MARVGQEISNPRTRQRMTFLDVQEDLLRIDSVNPSPTSASRCTSIPAKRAAPS
jgi:hypothetical protein